MEGKLHEIFIGHIIISSEKKKERKRKEDVYCTVHKADRKEWNYIVFIFCVSIISVNEWFTRLRACRQKVRRQWRKEKEII